MNKKFRLCIVFKLPIEVKKKGDIYVSCCPALDVWSQGDSKGEAEKNIKDAVSLFIISCFERGSIDQVLKDCGLHPLHSMQGNENTIDVSTPDANDEHMIEVPIPFNVNDPSPIEPCHA